jgi:hypothetical protein
MLSQIWVQFNREFVISQKKLRTKSGMPVSFGSQYGSKDLARIPLSVKFLIVLSSFAAYHKRYLDNEN